LKDYEEPNHKGRNQEDLSAARIKRKERLMDIIIGKLQRDWSEQINVRLFGLNIQGRLCLHACSERLGQSIDIVWG